MKKTILKGLLFGMFWGIGFLVIMIIGLVILKATDLSNVSDGEKIANTSWNTLLTKLNSAIGWSGTESLTAGTGDILTADKRNNLVTKVNTYTNIPDCAADNGGNCKITQSFKSELDADLAAGNIKSGVSVFGVNGSLPTYSNCVADNGGNCVIATASKSTLDTNLAAGNIKSGVSIFGINGSYVGGCSTPGKCVKSDGSCGTINVNRRRYRTSGGYRDGPFGNMATSLNTWYDVVSAAGGGVASVYVSCL